MNGDFHQERICTITELEFFKKYGFFLQTKKVNSGKIFYCHWHEYYEFEMFTGGEALHSFNNRKRKLECGSAYLVTPTESHRIEIREDSEIVNLRFKPELLTGSLSDFLLTVSNAEVTFGTDELKYICGRISALCQDKFGELFYAERAKCILCEILILFFRKLKINSAAKSRSTLIQDVINYVSNHFREDLSLYKVAAELSVTPKYLGSLFKQQMNMNFNEYLNNLRLQYACNILNASNDSIKEIAFNSGYNSEQYFLYIFKKYIKTTPSEYRKLTKKERLI